MEQVQEENNIPEGIVYIGAETWLKITKIKIKKIMEAARLVLMEAARWAMKVFEIIILKTNGSGAALM